MRYEIEMHSYQDEGVEFLRENPKAALWVDMGMGKTIMLLTLIRDLLREKSVQKILIVAPLKVAEQTWPNEIDEWEHTKDLRYTVIRHQNPAVRRQLAMSKTRIHIINREMLKWLVDMFAELRYWPYDMLVIDEVSSFKDHRTARFKALRRTISHYKRVYEMTATPVAEGMLGLFAQFYILDEGERFGRSVTKFREEYFDHNPYAHTYELKDGAEERLIEKISDITLVLRARDHLKLRKAEPLPRKLKLTDSEQAAYDKFERDLILKLPNDIEIEALTGAALNQKLLQAASGCVYDANKQAHNFHDHKLDDLEQLIEEADGTPVLVSYWFKSSRDRIRKRFPRSTIMDRSGRCVAPWNAGDIPILLAHPQSAGHGLNMQYGPCRNIYFFDTPWSHELYSQLILRVAGRQGQRYDVNVHHAVTKGTVDEAVMGKHELNQDVQGRLFQRLIDKRKEIKNGYRKAA